jgi:hypothetical protein
MKIEKAMRKHGFQKDCCSILFEGEINSSK